MDGVAEKEIAPDSAEKDIVRLFGEPTKGDLNGDGTEDAAVILERTSGGSGTFFYAALALQDADGAFVGTNALLLGDRIAPQGVVITDGRATVNYAVRGGDEPMSAQPSIGKSLTIHLDPATGEIGELAMDVGPDGTREPFAGEADPAKMFLGMKTWVWMRTEAAGKPVSSPKKADAFTLTFKNDGSFSVTTDCNGAGGSYTAEKGNLTVGQMMSTLMFCDGSQESEFTGQLAKMTQYRFTSRGELWLADPDGTKMVLR
jgi:heat shock protein HslJ